MAFTYALNPGDLGYTNGALPANPTQSQINSYFNVNNIAGYVGDDLLRLYRNLRTISGPTASINTDERRIAVRTGIHDINGNGIIELALGEADYHFMLQHSNGDWSEKHGSNPSVNDGSINPSTFSWDIPGYYTNYYNSATVYLAVQY